MLGPTHKVLNLPLSLTKMCELFMRKRQNGGLQWGPTYSQATL